MYYPDLMSHCRPRIKGRFVKASGAEASGLGDDEAMASEGPEEEEVEMA